MRRFLAIGRTTFLQTIRQPIYGVLIAATLGLLTFSVPMTGFTLSAGGDYHETDQKMLENLALGTLLMSGLLLAAFSASTVLAREIEEKTALTVISKPVARATFVLGKFAGSAAAVAVAFYLSSLVFLMTVRHGVLSSASDPLDVPVIVFGCGALAATLLAAILGNYFFGWSFTSASVTAGLISFTLAMGLIVFIDKEWKPTALVQVAFRDEPSETYAYDSPEFQKAHDKRVKENASAIEAGAERPPRTLETFPAKLAGGIRPQLLVGMAMIFLAVMVFAAAAIAASTRLGAVLTLLTCAVVFVVGWTHPSLFADADENAVVRALSWIAPNMTYFDPQDPLMADKPIPLRYLGLAAAYAACYVAALLAVGVALFQRRALEASTASSVMPGAVSVLAALGRFAAVGMAIAALAVVSLRQYRTPGGFLLAGGLLVAAVAGWLLWGYFGRGVRWSHRLVLGLTAAALLRLGAAWLAPDVGKTLGVDAQAPATAVQAAVLAGLLLLLVLPRTRRHFAGAS